MGFMDGLSVWTLACLIFCFRVLDVSLGTIRTITVVVGRIPLSVLLGFFEVLVWATAISQLILQIKDHPLLLTAYAGGFACGNAVGILLEKKLALGNCVVRMISRDGGSVEEAMRRFGRVLATFRSDSREDPEMLVFAALPRRHLPAALRKAREVDPQLFWVVERFSETSHLAPLPHATGWRAVFKKK